MNKNRFFKYFVTVLLLVFLLALPHLVGSIYWIHVLILSVINVLLAASLRSIFLTGEISLGSAGFMLLGAYSSALLVMKAGLSFWIALPLGGLFPAVLALIVGYPFLKCKGIYFSILTLLVAEVCRLLACYREELTGGQSGLHGIPAPNPIVIPGLTTISFNNKFSYYYLVLVIVVFSLFVIYRLEHSRIGLNWLGIKEADILAQSVGINIMGHKIFVFCVSCFFIGIAGSLFAHYMHLLSPNYSGQFAVMTSIYILIYMVVGGESSFFGPILGAAILTIVPELARPLKEYQPMIFGALLIIVVFFMPRGLMDLGSKSAGLYKKMLNRLDDTLQKHQT